MATEKFTIAAAGGRKEFKLYAEPTNINYYVRGNLTPDVASGVTNKQVSVRSTTVRQYPGDGTTFNRPGSAREVMIDPSRKSGNGLPGYSFVLVSDAGMPNEERRQFTYSGRWIDVHAWLRVNAKMQVHAFTHRGTRYTIPGTVANP